MASCVPIGIRGDQQLALLFLELQSKDKTAASTNSIEALAYSHEDPFQPLFGIKCAIKSCSGRSLESPAKLRFSLISAASFALQVTRGRRRSSLLPERQRSEGSGRIRNSTKLRVLSICQNQPAGPLPDQSV